MLDVNLLWQSFYSRCKSDHYAVNLKYVNYISINLGPVEIYLLPCRF